MYTLDRIAYRKKRKQYTAIGGDKPRVVPGKFDGLLDVEGAANI